MLRPLLLGLLALLLFSLEGMAASNPSANTAVAASSKVFIVPIRDDIATPMVFLVRRGVKAAIQAGADLLVLDMDTNGGRVDKTEEIINIIEQFKGTTVTYVNRKAFSAGAYISFATQKIYMAPEAVIGAATPILLAPGGGAQGMPESVEAKMTSACAALVRASAEKNGHNADVADAMVRRTKELVMDGKVLNKQGEILTLTSKAAQETYGNPPKPLLSLGTFPTLESLLQALGFGNAKQVRVEPTGWEQVGSFLSSQWVSSILLILGIGGIYIEFKTPGFGIPGIVGICAFGLYFLGGYLAGLSGAGWVVLFLLGLILVAVEFFVLPGTLLVGLAGVACILISLVMALADAYPNPEGWWPVFPSSDAFLRPANALLAATIGASCVVAFLIRYLPQSSMFRTAGANSVSGAQSDMRLEQERTVWIGKRGIALSNLRPGGKVIIGNVQLDAVTRGEMIEKGESVKVVGFSAAEAVVERVSSSDAA